MAVQGLPIEDESEMPAWCEEYLTPAQVENMLPRTRWAVLLDSAPLPPVAHHVALRLHLYAVGSTDATAYPSVDKLAAVTGWTRNTIRVALRQRRTGLGPGDGPPLSEREAGVDALHAHLAVGGRDDAAGHGALPGAAHRWLALPAGRRLGHAPPRCGAVLAARRGVGRGSADDR